jgi:hypothetical protein
MDVGAVRTTKFVDHRFMHALGRHQRKALRRSKHLAAKSDSVLTPVRSPCARPRAFYQRSRY